MKKLVSIVLALAMILMVSAAFAGTITVTPPSGLPADATTTYHVYRVFDAVVGSNGAISYKLVSGKNAPPAGFTVDSAGNVSYSGSGTNGELTAEDIAALKAYITDADLVATLTATGSEAVTSSNLADGYFFIDTTTGSLVTVDSTNPNANVNDKNSVPEIDKKITGASDITDSGKKALAQIGTDVEFTASITVGKGSINLVFHDTMDEGLTYKGNDNVTVTGVAADKYTIKATPDEGDTITITFADGIAEGTKIDIVYKATINEEALTKLENDAYLTYGDSYSTEHTSTETYNAEISVIKYDGDKADAKYLGGAGFKLKNADGKYYKLTGTVVSWEDEEEDGDEHVSAAADGKVPAFIGLANGTYTLVETTVPDGYNKAADVSLTIVSGDYSLDNLQQVAEIENKTGTELPSTGGIGTTIFYILGGLLVIGAAVVLVARRKAHD